MTRPRSALVANRSLACALVGVLFLLVAPTRVRAQDEIVSRANQSYQEGAFTDAVEAYEAVRQGGFTSAALEYNLGNAYYKAGDLARSILHWERALALDPGDEDALANLALARTLTVDEIEPLPEFWLVSVLRWWVDLLPRGALITLVGGGWILLTGGVAARLVSPTQLGSRVGRASAVAGGLLVVVLGINLVVRESGLGRAERGIVMIESVPVRSAPAAEDDLTLFQVHEGTRVRIDQQAGQWVEVVLDDGKVGWLPLEAIETI